MNFAGSSWKIQKVLTDAAGLRGVLRRIRYGTVLRDGNGEVPAFGTCGVEVVKEFVDIRGVAQRENNANKKQGARKPPERCHSGVA